MWVRRAFNHCASRADDPLLHTHVVVANLIQTADDGYGHLFPAQDEALAEALDGVLRDSLDEHQEQVADVHDLGADQS